MSTELLGQTVLPDSRHPVHVTLVTQSAALTGPWFNTFSLAAFGDEISGVPVGSSWTLPLSPSLRAMGMPNISIQNAGPLEQEGTDMRVIEETSGPEWKMVGFDASSAYADRLARVERRMVFVEPNLVVLYDRIQAPSPVSVQWALSVAGPIRVDPVWGHLILERPHSMWSVHLPAKKGEHRVWETLSNSSQDELSTQSRYRMGHLSPQKEFHLITVFVAHHAGEIKSVAVKALESDRAIGVRIHRAGWPTLVAFSLRAPSESVSLTGFSFKGPAAVDVLKPRASSP